MRERDIESRYLPLVQHLAGSLASRLPRHVPLDDLVSAGLLALTEAARAYDEARGVPFERYAATRIRGALLDELRSMDWAARSVRVKARAVDSCAQELTAQLRRQPTGEEVAATLGVPVAELHRIAWNVDRSVVVHYQAADDEGSDALLPLATGRPEDAVLEAERRAELRAAIEALPAKHRAVIDGWFFAGERMEDIATSLGVTASRVSQLRTEALVLLRDALGGAATPALADGRGARRRAAYRRALEAA